MKFVVVVLSLLLISRSPYRPFLLAGLIIVLRMKLPNLIISNLHRVAYYLAKDAAAQVRGHAWGRFGYYGIDMFVAMFGKGKTLSMTHRARRIYKQYGKKVRVFSNYHLEGIPYIPLQNFQQLVDLGTTEEEKDYVGTIVLLDEVSTLLSHRNFASFPLELLSMLCQQRKRRIYIMCSAQRFFMVDKIWRGITTHVVICNKKWRFVHNTFYDAWEYENATTSRVLQPVGHGWWFCSDADYASYDTEEMITRSAAHDFISNEEAIVRKGLDSQPVYNGAGLHLNKKAARASGHGRRRAG